MKLRPWETGWQGFSPRTFLRKNKPQIRHPIRTIIFNEAVKSGKTVLDVGCGTCIDFPLYMKAGLKYTGIDITEGFITYAKSIYPKMDARVGSILALPFKNGSFHVTYSKSVLDHMHPQEIGKAINELWRVTARKMMIAFDYAPLPKPQLIRMGARRKFYANRYDERDIVKTLRGLKDFKELRTMKNIGYNKMALYIVER
jgi:ubiquinone/menaquinone biosynthesis C-methylase UbiE